MNLENVKYDAFISYRHCELDKFVAVNLHKQLEAFKIPKSLINAGKTNGKTKIERVFRDQDELPLTNNLADPITRALQGSEFLIVICSPRLKESKWCLTEIETFISMHGRDHILAVLIEGEPADSFPEILRFEERVITDEYGYTRLEKFEVEPLAADVRGKNKSEILKKIKSELLRLVAPMLNCNYDDLKMRHKEARQKKILRVSFAISLVCLIFTAISTTMALTIHKQANTIEEQYHTALKNQAISHASISQTLLKKEDRMAAIAVARMVLPDSLDNQTEKAYTPAAEFALSDSLAIYNNGEKNFPVKSLEQNSPIRFMIVSPDETTITTVNTNGIITIFDIATASVVDSFTTADDGLANVYNENEIAYLGSNKLAYLGFNGFYIYDISTKKDEFYNLDVTTNYISTSSDGEYIGISADDSFEIYDKNGKNVYSHPFPSTHTGDSAISFNTEKKLCAFTCTSNEKDTPYGFIYVINYGTSEEIYSKQLDIASFTKCAFYGEQLIVVGEKHYNLGDSLMDFSIDTHIYAFPLDSNTINWEFVKKDVILDEVTGATQWENRTLVVSNYDEITFISSHDGSVIHTTTLGSSIVDITPLVQEGSVLANTARGEEMLVNYNPDSENLVVTKFDITNGNFADFYDSNNFIAAHHENSTMINIYKKITSDQAKEVTTFDNYISKSIYSAKQNAFLILTFANQYVLNTNGKEHVIELPNSYYTNDVFFSGDNDEYIVTISNDTIAYYNSTNGELMKEFSISDEFIQFGVIPSIYIGHTKDRKTIVYASMDDDTLCLYSTTDNTAKIIPSQKILPTSTELIGMNETAERYAIVNKENNTLSVFDTNYDMIVETEINAALVTSVIVSDEADCVIVSYLDQTVTLYQLSDLTPTKTFTNIQSEITQLDVVSFLDSNENTPAYALYGLSECYLLDENLEPLARIHRYVGYNEEEQLFYLINSNQILSVPYYNYDMLIKEADKLLENYELSDYRKNQLGI